MSKSNGDKFKIGAWISLETKRKADLYRALSGKPLQDIYEQALDFFLNSAMPNLDKTSSGEFLDAHINH
jgi:hypothetical protein